MKLTRDWIKNQIGEYTSMMTHLTDDPNDKTLKTIWGERINTLQSVLEVIEIEMRA